MSTRALVLATLLIAAPIASGSVGYQPLTIPDPAGEPLVAGVWYPSSSESSSQTLGTTTQVVALTGAVEGKQLPLILISHGTSGSSLSHYDTALSLAEAGFVVAAVTHTGDNYLDQRYAGNDRNLIDRPRQIAHVADFMLTAWAGRSHLDPTRIGIMGMSVGGFTALVEIGGVPDLGRMAQLCKDRPDAPECAFIRGRHGNQLERPPSAPAWTHDGRIKAAVIVAPAASFLFGPGSLVNVRIPVQLWRAANDTQAPDEWNSAVVRKALPARADEHVVRGADHFAFLAPCSAQLAKAVPRICVDPPGFDRAAFHRDFNRTIIAFLRQSLR